MTPALLAALLLASASFASKDSHRFGEIDERSEVTNPYMVEAVKSVSDANLENAMSKARAEAAKAAANLLQLSASLSNGAAALASEAGKDYEPDLGPFLEAVKAFRRAAEAAAIRLPSADSPKSLYSAPNRRADLSLAQGYAKAADAKRKGVSLTKADKAAAARAFDVAAAAAGLLPKKKLPPALAARLGPLTADSDSLKVEALAFERALHLDAHAQADFDDAPD